MGAKVNVRGEPLRVLSLHVLLGVLVRVEMDNRSLLKSGQQDRAKSSCKLLMHLYQCCPGKVASSDGKSRPLNVLWPVLPGNDLKSRGRKWSPERSIRTRHSEG